MWSMRIRKFSTWAHVSFTTYMKWVAWQDSKHDELHSTQIKRFVRCCKDKSKARQERSQAVILSKLSASLINRDISVPNHRNLFSNKIEVQHLFEVLSRTTFVSTTMRTCQLDSECWLLKKKIVISFRLKIEFLSNFCSAQLLRK